MAWTMDANSALDSKDPKEMRSCVEDLQNDIDELEQAIAAAESLLGDEAGKRVEDALVSVCQKMKDVSTSASHGLTPAKAYEQALTDLCLHAAGIGKSVVA